jgi:TPR repeat protein
MLRDFVLSARIAGVVMNFPLYDGGVSETARRLIAGGRLDEALDEYRRLAELGSGLAKCVLAYLNLRDLPRRPRDVIAAKSLANAALNAEPGYASYILAYAASFEKNPPKAAGLMVKSHEARFVPAASALGLILSQGYGTSKNAKKAEIFFLRAIFAWHNPAPMLLCRFYIRGDCGLIKRVLGFLFFPFAFAYAWICVRFSIFSVYTFRHFNVSVPPMFNERALRTTAS